MQPRLYDGSITPELLIAVTSMKGKFLETMLVGS